MGVIPLGLFILEMWLLRKIEGMLLVSNWIYEREERKRIHEIGSENCNRSETQKANDV